MVCPLLRGSSPTRGVAPKQHRTRRLLTNRPCSSLVYEESDSKEREIRLTRGSREFLERVQAKYPGRYADGLIRTVQRRIKIWRGARARELMFGPFADAEPSNADTHTQP